VWYSTAGLGEPEIFLRGFAADKVRFLVNGIPMNEQDDQSLYWSNWAGLPSMVASIEVQRGPAFSLIGSGGFGGSVHIETMGITTKKATILRASFGFYNTSGIESGSKRGEVANGIGGLDEYKPINYTYYVRHNSGPLHDGKLNISIIGVRKTGDSYIHGTGYDGYAFGLEAQSDLGKHKLRLNFIGAPQFHNQAFSLQDIDLLKTLGREYNRKNHQWQENSYFKPLWSLRHDWDFSENKTLSSTAFFTLAKGADQSLANGMFNVEIGEIALQPVSRSTDYQAFGRHAGYLLQNYGIIMTDYYPSIEPGEPPYFRDFEIRGSPANFFTDQHSHSWQNRRRRDHRQLGLFSYFQYRLNPQFQVVVGGEGRQWNGHRTSEAWKIVKSIDNPIRDGQPTFVERTQNIYDYDTKVASLSGFGRVTFKPNSLVTLQTGGQFFHTAMQVSENPINLFDFGSGKTMDFAVRTSADQIDEAGLPKFTADDYERDYSFVAAWIGSNFNLTNEINLFANFANAKKEPSIADWYDSDKGPAANQLNGQDLDPESVNSLEFGLAYNAPRIKLGANYYRTIYKDKIESVLDFFDRRETINAGRALYQGVEFEASALFGPFDFSASATFSRNRWNDMNVKEIFGADADEVVGKVVPFSPERMLSAAMGFSGDGNRIALRLNWWDEYFATFTNRYTRIDGTVADARLPYFLDLSAQLSHSTKFEHVDVTFRIEANNILNRSDNFMRAQYSVDYTRTDALAGQLHWYVLQAPLFNAFFTTEIHIP
jgi:outer membrane receptor protein involved in Fe transport